MEIEEINHRSCKRSRVVGNGKLEPRENYQDEDEDDGETKGEINNNNTAGASNSNNNRMIRPWNHPSSRIIRVSRASGGKDRHSKVITAKGLRDRRVRLSVSTAIQFYDLQDRLGYDQPSKAIEWLIKAAASAIDELPSLDTNFPEAALDYHHHQQQQQQQLINIEQPMPSDSGMDPDADPSYNQQQHSSTSETSKGSVLSLSRSESRVRARERAKERVMDKKKDRDDAHVVSHHQNVADQSLNSQESFTKLLTGGSSSTAAVTVTAGQASSSTANFIQKQMQNLPPVTSTADYFSTQSSLFGQHPPQQKGATTHQISTSGFTSQAHFGNSSPIGMVPLISGNAGDGHPGVEMQQFAFLQDHFFPVAAAAAAAASGGDYNLNFSISPSLAGFHRGTLQSNSPTHNHQHHHQLSHHNHHHHQVQAQRLSSALDGSSVPFFFGAAASAAGASPAENPYASGFDGHLQLCDGYRHLELKGKGKS